MEVWLFHGRQDTGSHSYQYLKIKNTLVLLPVACMMVKEEDVNQEEVDDTRGEVETRIFSSVSVGHMVGDVACLCDVLKCLYSCGHIL